MRILVTGGAGYIGSHTCVELLAAGHQVVVVDNLSNSHERALDRVQEISGKSLTFRCLDLRDRDELDATFREFDFDAVIHFASMKAVGESVAKPLLYYQNNIGGALTLLDVMQDHDVRNMVFSSSATVYGDPDTVPIREDARIQATNPYGQTKVSIEQILNDLVVSDRAWRFVSLRYFNPVGAHPSGRIGEDPNGIPNNLMPFVAQVAVGKLSHLRVFGDDWDTPDGTGIRDYIHVVDLALGHLKALDLFGDDAFVAAGGHRVYNLGTGRGSSVLEVRAAFERACEREIPFEIVARRDGDVARCYADPSKAEHELDWKATRDLDDMCRDAWAWQKANPSGYAD